LAPHPQEIGQSFLNLCTVGQKTAVKVYHAKKTLQLFDVLRGWAIFDLGSVIGYWGRSCRRNLMSKDFKGGCCKNTFFQVDGEAIGG
jgi:hypothetical protein